MQKYMNKINAKNK